MTRDGLKLVLFDMDGTLIDSRATIVAAMTRGFLDEGLPPPPATRIHHVVGLSLEEALKALAPDQPADRLRRVGEAYRAAYSRRSDGTSDTEPLFGGMRDVLTALEEAGLLLGIATGKARRGLDAILERQGLTGRFLTLQTGDTGPSKPNPDMVFRALRETGANAAETVVVGDTTFDIEMARAAGAGAVGVTWGFHPASALVAAGADAIVSETERLAQAILDVLATERGTKEPA